MKVVLTQPNYMWFGKRSWDLPPYTLAILNASLGGYAEILDPNHDNMTPNEVFKYFAEFKPDVVGISSISTEYIEACRQMSAIVKGAAPDAIVIQGGIIPTVVIETAMRDPNVDYWVMGEGERTLPELMNQLPGEPSTDGIAYWDNGIVRINQVRDFIMDLDEIPLPDYGNLNPLDYGYMINKYAAGLLPRRFPYAITITSRGCPYQCIFCAAATVSGRRMRFRSSRNVIEEVDSLYSQGIREVIFLDDHFLASRKRASEIMHGLRNYDLTWKPVNVTIFHIDREILELMRESGCYQLTLSIESGNQDVLTNIIRKPIKLMQVHPFIEEAKSLGFEIIANFVIGFPGETWEQIRETFSFAESINVDLVNFHIATPLPKTELMDICLREGYLSESKNLPTGYTKGMISTNDFTPSELETLRAFEWDRINFKTASRRETIARMEGITLEELEQWRIATRRKQGISVLTKGEIS